MYVIHYGRKKYLLPQEYNELTPRQLKQLALLHGSAGDKEVILLKMLRVLLRMHPVTFGMLPADMIDRVIPYMSWLTEKNTLTEQLMPRYRLFPGCRWYYGPASEIENMLLVEFHFAEKYYYQMVEAGKSDEDGSAGEEMEALNKLVAVIYRRPKPGYDKARDKDGDIRLPFNNNEIPFFSKKIQHWPLSVKLAIVMFYDGCRQKLVEDNEEIFDGNDGSEDEDGLYGVIRGIAGEKFGPFEKVEVMNVHSALFEMRTQKKEAENIQD